MSASGALLADETISLEGRDLAGAVSLEGLMDLVRVAMGAKGRDAPVSVEDGAGGALHLSHRMYLLISFR